MVGLIAIFILLAVVSFMILLAGISKISQLSMRVDRLEAQLRNTGSSQPSAAGPSRAGAASSTGQQSPAAPEVNAQPPAPAAAIPQPHPSLRPAPAPAHPSRTREEWEALIGGRLMNRIGALALIIGVGFFLKYAFDNNWLTETMRVLIGAVSGGALLLGAARFYRKKLEVFAQGLVGAGIAILYLSVYASFNFYHLVSQPVAFLLMTVVTIVTFVNAFAYNARAVALLGWAGGFLTPFMLSTGQANEIGLFSYIAILDAGLLVIALRKTEWDLLEPLTFIATYVMFFVWYNQYYAPADLFPTAVFVTIFWGLFFTVDTVNIVRNVASSTELRTAAGILNAILYYGTLYSLIDSEYHSWMGAVTLALGIVYFATGYSASQRGALSGAALVRYTVIAIVLAVIATAVQFSDFTLIMFWSVEALALLWAGSRWSEKAITVCGLVLFAVATLGLLCTRGALIYQPIEQFSLLFNVRAATFGLLALCLGAGAWLVRSTGAAAGRNIAGALDGTWIFIVFALLSVETFDIFRQRLIDAAGDGRTWLSFQRNMTLAGVWAVFAGVLSWTGARWKMSSHLFGSIAVIAIAVLLAIVRGIAFEPLSHFTFILNFRAMIMLLVIASVAVTGLSLRNANQEKWIRQSVDALAVAAVVLLLTLVTGETRDVFEKALRETGASLDEAGLRAAKGIRSLEQLSLSAAWLIYSIVLMSIGIWRRVRNLRVIAIVLFGITILKIFIYDLSFLETLYRIFSFIGLGVILLAVSYLYQHFKGVIFQEHAGAKPESPVVQ